eukprot:8132863-Ditylum_brightwellii.AAC.1
MERAEILVNIGSARDATDNPSTVQPTMIPRSPCTPPVHIQALHNLHAGQNSQVLCSAGDPYSTELDGQSNSMLSGFDNSCSGITAHSVCSGLEQVNKNSSSSSNEDYHQSDDGDHCYDLEEVTSDRGEEDLEDPNCLKLPHFLAKETVKEKKDFSVEDVYEEEAEELDCD